ncbi:hypothetical protein [Bartonella queenslandensis]|uniref:hypothetical protein n=1 Tax=Bartonella queenslandensis TaxID=481138 RepID=UPI001BA7087F|nr:hypothetical protein [Bartonella queenslandensis]
MKKCSGGVNEGFILQEGADWLHFVAVAECVCKQAEHLGLTWLWFSNKWVSIGIFVFLVHFMSAFFHEGMRCVGLMLGRGLKRMGILLR